MDLNPLVIWQQMSPINKIVIVILILLSIWSLYVLTVRLALLSGDVAWRTAFARACRAPCP